MGSLPPLYRLKWSDFPQHEGYLRADSARVSRWRERLGEISPLPKIGISWRGGTALTRRNLRSIGLERGERVRTAEIVTRRARL